MKVIITARVKNAYLVEIRKALGYKTIKAFAEATGLNYQQVCITENFHYYPKMKATIKRWEKAYRAPAEILFPPEFKIAVDQELGKPIRFTREFLGLPGPDSPIAYLESWDEKNGHPEDHVLGALKTLTEQEAKVLKMKFGLDGNEKIPVKEIAKHLKVCRGRVHQIEAKALRKMKHPSRCRELRRPQR